MPSKTRVQFFGGSTLLCAREFVSEKDPVVCIVSILNAPGARARINSISHMNFFNEEQIINILLDKADYICVGRDPKDFWVGLNPQATIIYTPNLPEAQKGAN